MRITTLALVTTLALAGAASAADLSKAAPAASPDVAQQAALYAARQSWPEAAAAYRQAVAASPHDASLHNRLGMCYQRLGDVNAARAAYRRATELRKDYAEAWNNIGTLEHGRGRYKQAIAAYSRAIGIKPGEAVFYKNLGSAWLARGNVEKTLEAWNEALRLDPAALETDAVKVPGGGVDAAKQYFLFAKVAAARGDVERALEFLKRAQAAGFNEFAKLEHDADFASIVKDPRYAALK
ncbi:MAG TPA: tetratricopeptide repeat protein [Vicinamibacteria bacterium]|nr:tetratricopeptide repeat protein [Vicinamibacteria bacterium]